MIENNNRGIVSHHGFRSENSFVYYQVFGHYVIKDNDKEAEND